MPSALPQRPANNALQTSEVTGKGKATNDNELVEGRCIRAAFGAVPWRLRIRGFCLIRRKKISICQR